MHELSLVVTMASMHTHFIITCIYAWAFPSGNHGIPAHTTYTWALPSGNHGIPAHTTYYNMHICMSSPCSAMGLWHFGSHNGFSTNVPSSVMLPSEQWRCYVSGYTLQYRAAQKEQVHRVYTIVTDMQFHWSTGVVLVYLQTCYLGYRKRPSRSNNKWWTTKGKFIS